MRPHRRWLALAAPAALAALAMGCAPAASTAPAATAPHVSGVVHIVHRGLVKDCEYITNALASENSHEVVAISGNGVDQQVSLKATGNCFTLYNKFTDKINGVSYTGYQYQNGDGHCLWDNGGIVELGGACVAGQHNEQFFGASLTPGFGWVVSDVAEGLSRVLNAPGCALGALVTVNVIMANCAIWNFPHA
jgi:hypothetical protein